MKRTPDFYRGFLVPGDYLLEEALGAGQDGEVWRVLKRTLKKTFAVKFLNAVEDKDKRRRFDTEIEILASLHHPNIISISDKNEATNPRTKQIVPFYVMEFLEASPLDEYLDNHQEKTLRVFCSLLEQTALALLEVHSNGLSHGDIKSANVMVVKKTGTPILTDFGFGLKPGESGNRTEYPSSSYEAPEGLTPQQADVYRLGRTFLDALARARKRLSRVVDSELTEQLTALTEEPSDAVLERAISRLEAIQEKARISSAAREAYVELASRIPELSTSPRGTIVSDPIQGFITLSSRARAIIDLPEFQRLRHQKHIPECELVYPAMTQTRLECAFGTFGQMVKYTRALADLPLFRSAQDAPEISLALAGCLLVELGRYPFSHIVRQVSPHSTNLQPSVRAASLVVSGRIREILETEWNISAETMADLLTAGDSDRFTKIQKLAAYLLNGTLSAAAVDNLLRTAWRAGLRHSFDEERFTRAIRISPSTFQIAFPIDRLTALGDFLSARHSIIERVYGFHTVRSARKMLLHAFFEVGNFEDIPDSDDAFFETIVSRSREAGLTRALNLLVWYRKRAIHKQLMAFDSIGENEQNLIEAWAHYADAPDSLRLEVAFSKRVEEALSRLCKFPLEPGSVVFDFGERPPSFDVPLLGPEGQEVEAKAFSPFRQLREVATRTSFVQRLFLTADASAKLHSNTRSQIMNIVYSVLFDQPERERYL